MNEPMLKKAMTTLEFLSQDEQTRMEYEARQKYLLDEASRVAGAKAEGRAEDQLRFDHRLFTILYAHSLRDGTSIIRLPALFDKYAPERDDLAQNALEQSFIVHLVHERLILPSGLDKNGAPAGHLPMIIHMLAGEMIAVYA